jgi:hypothetical protein
MSWRAREREILARIETAVTACDPGRCAFMAMHSDRRAGGTSSVPRDVPQALASGLYQRVSGWQHPLTACGGIAQ